MLPSDFSVHSLCVCLFKNGDLWDPVSSAVGPWCLKQAISAVGASVGVLWAREH